MTPHTIFERAIALAALCFLGAAPSSALTKDGLYICAEHVDQSDWDAEFSNGPIVIPAGTVFDFAGHIIGGNLQDPKDSATIDSPNSSGKHADFIWNKDLEPNGCSDLPGTSLKHCN
jgi:hypothetical protein